jgi:hypothetical protein
MSPQNDRLANLEEFLRCVIEDCKADTATVDAGVGAIAMLIEAVDARDWDSVAIWMQALHRVDPPHKTAAVAEGNSTYMAMDATSRFVH